MLFFFYLLACRYSGIEIARKTKFGSQAAMNGLITLFTLKVVLTVEKRIYAAVRMMPIPKFFPMPRRIRRLDIVTPSSVMINAPTAEAQRL